MRGRDFRNHSVKDGLILPDGAVINMTFCFDAFAIAEDTYKGIFKQDKDISDIIDGISKDNSSVLCIAYGATKVNHTEITFRDFLEEIYGKDKNSIMLQIVVDGLNKCFVPAKESIVAENKPTNSGFPWDKYYKIALELGMTDAEFWAATPRKIQYLSRDPEKTTRAMELTNKYT